MRTVTFSCCINTSFTSTKCNKPVFSCCKNSRTQSTSRMASVTHWLVLGSTAHAYMILFARFNLYRIWSLLGAFWFCHNFLTIQPLSKFTDYDFGCFLEHSMQNSPTSKTLSSFLQSLHLLSDLVLS